MERYEVDQDDWERREVYAHFGLAVYAGQILETQVVNHLVSVRAERRTLGQAFDVDTVYRRLFGQTFGTNLGEIRDLLGADWPLAQELAEALAVRNELIHHFWRRRILKLVTSAGRAELIGELDEIANRLRALDERLTELTLAKAAKYGVTPELLEQAFEHLPSLPEHAAVPPDLDLY